MARLTVVVQRQGPLDLAELHRHVAAVQDAGYRGVVTTAVAPLDEAVFLAAGFHVVERLHLLRHPLTGPGPGDPTRGAEARGPAGRGGGRPRRARRREQPAILAVDRAAFTPFWQLDDTLLGEALAATRSVHWTVARDGEGAVIGYAICGRTGARGYVQRLAVHPDHQGQGVGAGLLGDGLRWLARRGAREALVNTQHGNDRSLRLYQRSGFVLQPGGLSVLQLEFEPGGDPAAGQRPDLGSARGR